MYFAPISQDLLFTWVFTVTELPDVTPKMMTWSLPTLAPCAMPEMYELCITTQSTLISAIRLQTHLCMPYALWLQQCAYDQGDAFVPIPSPPCSTERPTRALPGVPVEAP